MQVPPIYSAIKKDGKRAYEFARKGHDIELEARKITVGKFDTSLANGVITFRVVCSTGTYIRSLAHDIGQHLGCGGHLTSLCRTRIGDFQLNDAWTMEQAEEKIKEMLHQNENG
jgi:tRNA pseudouridine55 synthase